MDKQKSKKSKNKSTLKNKIVENYKLFSVYCVRNKNGNSKFHDFKKKLCKYYIVFYVLGLNYNSQLLYNLLFILLIYYLLFIIITKIIIQT